MQESRRCCCIDKSMRPPRIRLIYRSENAYWCMMSYRCVPPSIFVRPSIESINWSNQSIDRWILMSSIWNIHVPSVDICPLDMRPSASTLIDRLGKCVPAFCFSTNVSPPSVYVRLLYIYIYQFIESIASIYEYWYLWFEYRHRPVLPSSHIFVSVSIGGYICFSVDIPGQLMRPDIWCLTDVSWKSHTDFAKFLLWDIYVCLSKINLFSHFVTKWWYRAVLRAGIVMFSLRS